MSNNAERILNVVRRIPRGKVATYGQVAQLAGFPRNARQVGAVLGSLAPDSEVPWFRVVNARGTISRRGSDCADLQRHALENEGIEFDTKDRIALKTYGWTPPRSADFGI